MNMHRLLLFGQGVGTVRTKKSSWPASYRSDKFQIENAKFVISCVVRQLLFTHHSTILHDLRLYLRI